MRCLTSKVAMSFENNKEKIYGFQFHPESFLTINGNILIKKSYQLKDLKQIQFHDLWENHGIFTTMWIFGKPAKILFFNNHLKNLILSLKKYQITKKSLKEDILKIINNNLSKNKKYNHLLRIAVNKKIISISLRKKSNQN